MNGNFIPLAGGDPVPLLKEKILIGRRADCDVRLDYHNVSGKHCQMTFDKGSWLIEDKDSTNGVMVNGVRILRRRLKPGDDVTIARKHHFRIEYRIEGNARFDDEEILYERSRQGEYNPEDLFLDSRRLGTRRNEEEAHKIFGKSLLDRAGLEKQKIEEMPQADEEPYQEDERVELDEDL